MTVDTTFNNRLQPINIQVNGGSLLGLAYGYCPLGDCTKNNGNVLTQTIGFSVGGGYNEVQTYTYDPLNRLQQAQTPSWTQRNGYDTWGNRWVSIQTGLWPLSNLTPQGTDTQSNWFNTNKNQISVSGWNYDNAGNLLNVGVNALSYDGEDRIASRTNSPYATQYSYDAEGRRIMKTELLSGQTQSTTVFVYDGQGQLAAEYGASTDTGRSYLVSDTLGSTRLVLDGTTGAVKARYDYLPYGEEIWATYGGRSTALGYRDAGTYDQPDRIPMKFTGKERDAESGLDFFGLRYFSSAEGRFTSPDKPFADQNTPDPQSWNMYSYVRNNPLRFVDPDGRECKDGVNEEGNACFTTTVHGSWVGTLLSKIGSFLKGTGEEATVNTFLGFTNTIDRMRQKSFGGPDLTQPLIHATTNAEQYGQYAGMIVPLFIPGGEVEETVTLFRAVSRGEAAQVLAEGAFKAGENSLGGKFFAETAGDASKWGDLLQGPGNYEIIKVELPKSAADSLMRWERLDGIGPARYGELNQINVSGLKVTGK